MIFRVVDKNRCLIKMLKFSINTLSKTLQSAKIKCDRYPGVVSFSLKIAMQIQFRDL